MDVTASSQQARAVNDASRRRSSNRRSGRGRGTQANTSLELRPASIAPQATIPATTTTTEGPRLTNESSVDPTNHSRGRGSGRGRARRSTQYRTVNGRHFGGQLTQQEETSASSDISTNADLHGNATAFVPGQQYSAGDAATRHKQTKALHGRRASKSQAPDIASRTHEDINNGQYECLICFNEVRRNSKVWSCHTCWSVFHLPCIKKWATNEGSVAAQQNVQAQDNEPAHPRRWRCPGCNLPKSELPQTYTCWCEKELEPRSPIGLPPHSCGNTCSQQRVRICPHPCDLVCHAGPHPHCEHAGPTQVCFCGKHEVTKRCSETDYDNGWSCGEVCGEMLPCSAHYCPRLCHEGICGACDVPLPSRCYCGQVEKEIPCDDRGESKNSERIPACVRPASEHNGTHEAASSTSSDSIMETWMGSFACGNVCGRQFDCLDHTCRQQCHTQSAEPSHCPYSTDMVTHCPCGKTPLKQLLDKPRERCTDSIPQCAKSCDRQLSCGHSCEMLCHESECQPCMKTVETRCRCGRTTFDTICHRGQEQAPQCNRTCKVLLNCGRHSCLEICCSGERKGAERQSVKRKLRPLASASRPLDDLFEAEHICTHSCGRLLRCNEHLCEELCHKGSCGSCKEAIFEEISCHCGRTVLQPPLPCGTQPPPCPLPCNRHKACAHPQVSHNCHGDDVHCPFCPYLVEKRCMCGKKTLKNQKCWQEDVRCGEICQLTKKCGSHVCKKTCHRPGECEDASGQPCLQSCGKPKKACGHPDLENACHAPFPCKEDKPCLSVIFIFCDCGSQKQEMKCGGSKSASGNSEKTLPCNDECGRLERNRKLALALNIDQATHTDGGDHIPYTSTTLDLFVENAPWAQDQEREFRVFANSEEEKRLRFKPMKSRQRAFIHALAEDFGFDSEGMDPEPHRHVMIWKTPRFVSPPSKTLADSIRIRKAQRISNTSTNVSDVEDQMKKQNRNAISSQPFNSFVISKPRFGLTIEELRAEVNTMVHSELALTFDIEFLPNEEVVLKAVSRTLTDSDLQQALRSVKEQAVSSFSTKGFGTPELCAVDNSLSILHRESDTDQSSDGWSKVVAKKAAPRVAVSTGSTTGSNSFSALDGKVTFAKKPPKKVKVQKAAVVEDWEVAELAEEAKEHATSGNSGDEAVDALDAPLPVDGGPGSLDEKEEQQPEA